jgi:hypothetical protein
VWAECRVLGTELGGTYGLKGKECDDGIACGRKFTGRFKSYGL